MDHGASCGTTTSRSVDDTPRREFPEIVGESPCAAGRPGHRTSPTHFLRGERDRSETKIRTAEHQLAGDRRGGWVTKPPGSESKTGSIGSVTGTGQPKGPCDSYSRGPFTYFRRRVWLARMFTSREHHSVLRRGRRPCAGARPPPRRHPRRRPHGRHRRPVLRRDVPHAVDRLDRRQRHLTAVPPHLARLLDDRRRRLRQRHQGRGHRLPAVARAAAPTASPGRRRSPPWSAPSGRASSGAAVAGAAGPAGQARQLDRHRRRLRAGHRQRGAQLPVRRTASPPTASSARPPGRSCSAPAAADRPRARRTTRSRTSRSRTPAPSSASARAPACRSTAG